MKLKRLITRLTVALSIAAFSATTVNANGHKEKNNPRGPKSPETTAALVNDAKGVCNVLGVNSAPCVLLVTTDDLEFTGKNNTKIAETLARDAASIVIEIQDGIDTQDELLDANSKWCQAIKSLMSYNQEYYTSKDEGKISGDSTDVNTVEGDIGTDGDITTGDIWNLIVNTLANPAPSCD
jgi:hypothetical protein